MNGIHDMGGMHGMGAIEYEAREPVFHAPWEARVLGTQPRHGRLAQMEHRRHAARDRAHSPEQSTCA